MFKTILLTLLLVMAVVIGAQFATSGEARGDDEGLSLLHRTADVVAVNNGQYREECGSCHMAYSPGLLPARSWRKLMGGLDKHFGDNAELDAQTRQDITGYLVNHSADHGDYRRSAQILRGIPSGETPLRITETKFFRREHHELPAGLVSDNARVKSFSNCDACHQRAERGSFSEREIRVPGYGRWDD